MHLPANDGKTRWLNLQPVIIEARIVVLGRAETGVVCIVSNHGFIQERFSRVRTWTRILERSV
jgi:hypothetical protein